MTGNRLPEGLAASRDSRAKGNSIMPILSIISTLSTSPAPAQAPRRRGFSLLEMLVVVALIGLLLGISTSILAGMKEKARGTVTRDTAKQLAEAWTRHLQALGEWPDTILDFPTSDSAHLKILNRMSGDTPSLGYYFLETKEKERDEGLKDSWGNLFSLWFDTDYDGQVPHPAKPSETIKAAVVVASPGKDGKMGTNDDIVVY